MYSEVRGIRGENRGARSILRVTNAAGSYLAGMRALVLLLVAVPSPLLAQLAGSLEARTYTSPGSSFTLRLRRCWTTPRS